MQRLYSGTGSGWSQTFTYDGFGNLTNKVGTGTAPSNSSPVNAATNQLTGNTYDANGNLISTGFGWDPENRMSYAIAGGVQYGSDSANKRVWAGNFTCPGGGCSPGNGWQITSETVFFYGSGGQRLTAYTPQVQYVNGTPQSIYYLLGEQRVYFGRKYVGNANTSLMSGGTVIGQDRLGSNGKYFPYGEERSSLSNDQVKFATYTRDSATGLDYADQRYYAGGSARFLSPDPYRASGGPGDSQSWNRYAYTRDDPIGRYDPSGLADEGPPPTPVFTYCPDGTIVFYGGTPCPTTPYFQGLPPVDVTPGLNLVNMQNMQTLRDAVKRASDLLRNNSKCAGLFANSSGAYPSSVYGRSPATMLDSYENAGLILASFMYYDPRDHQVHAFGSVDVGGVTEVATASLPTPGGVRVTASTITINTFGFFFTGNTSYGTPVNRLQGQGFEGLSLEDTQVAIIIHELLHAAGLIDPDGPGSPAGTEQHNKEIVRNACFP